ncbi:MAG: family FAD-dependent oxidoreductase [Verrucomicrobiales bacterium]|nr:family FAD-dependent oxidoreductase [Verrucomicrobiales bacterium]
MSLFSFPDTSSITGAEPASRSRSIVIVGGGIIGLAHALTAREAGHEVTLIERETRPLGASVRNFGTIWPIGLAFGPEREQGLFGMRRWRELGPLAGFAADPCGSLSLAYRGEAWDVLTEFSSQPGAPEGFTLLTPEETLARFPMANPDGLRGALFSPQETCVRPMDALTALTAHAARRGVKFETGVCVIKVHDDAVELADGRLFRFDHCVVAAGEDMKTLFPIELAAASIRPCRLQMMRTEPVAGRLGAIMVSDLTLAHYPAFSQCPSLPALKQKIADTMAEHLAWGVHVIAAQHADGSLTLGDSHEYGQSLTPDIWMQVDDLVLENLATFTRLPGLKIASRWQGTYLKSTTGQTQVVLQPRERVTMVTAMGGLGMTLSWGLARSTVASWELLKEPVETLL